MKKIILLLVLLLTLVTTASAKTTEYPVTLSKAKQVVCRAYIAREFKGDKLLATFSEKDNTYFMYDLTQNGDVLTNSSKEELKYKYTGTNVKGFMTFMMNDKSYINIGDKEIKDLTTYKFFLAMPEDDIVFIGKCLLR
jgi:hypothetical protein